MPHAQSLADGSFRLRAGSYAGNAKKRAQQNHLPASNLTTMSQRNLTVCNAKSGESLLRGESTTSFDFAPEGGAVDFEDGASFGSGLLL